MTLEDVCGDDAPTGPRAAAWKRVETALAEGKPKTAADALAGIEQAAVAEKAWAEAVRAIATRVITETGDRPPDDPERLLLLATAVEQAPPETRGVLEAIRANWTWGFFMNNRWRFAQRTSGGAADGDLRSITSWDLPQIVGEIRARFTAALGAKDALQKLPVAEWNVILEPGTMPDAYRPTVWDVVVRDALEFAESGERGLVDPEDAFEMSADGPALGTLEEFLAWRPAENPAVTDRDSPLLQAAGLYRDLLEFHKNDADRTALFSADLDRILWASGHAVGDELADRKGEALEAFIAKADDHETSALARYHLATLVREENDLVEARAIAAKAVAQHPKSPGGKLCKNLIAEIEAKSLTVFVERTWTRPWPVIRVRYRNLADVHLRVVKADWLERVLAGRSHVGWLDDAERAKLLAAAPAKAFKAELPPTDDYQERSHDIPLPQDLTPGSYWVIASPRGDFGEKDNVVSAGLVWVSRLALVTNGSNPQTGQPLTGHVVDIASGEPLANASVQMFVQQQGHPPRFAPGKTATTDRDGRYELPAELLAEQGGREVVLLVKASLDGRDEMVGSEPAHTWQQPPQEAHNTIVIMTDRGIHRPGQIVFYKGILCHADPEKGEYAALAGQPVKAVLRDANGREVAQAEHKTNTNGSFHGTFAIATGALPGQWTILAEGPSAAGVVNVRVEEYKRPKFQVKLGAATGEVVLDREVTLTGTATTYTGLPVAGAKVRYRVEREMRFPDWCHWFYPWLPFGGSAANIARGTAVTDANGAFTVTFPAKPDRTVPRESAPVFTYAVKADVTDAAGETRSDERRVSAGYAAIEAALSAEKWQEVGMAGEPAAVAITLATHSLDGDPRAAGGTLKIFKLFQPAEVARGDTFEPAPHPMPRRRGGRPGAIPPKPPASDPSDPETWAAGDVVFTETVRTDPATGKVLATAKLPAGIYRAEFEVAQSDPPVKARRTIEVIDPNATRYPVKRPFLLTAQRLTAEPGSEFRAIAGTGYDRGRMLVEVSQSGKTLARFWTEPGRTQWPIAVKVGEEHRGGFSIRAWLVRDGRLHAETLTVDVPWTNKQLSIAWERFTRRVEPAAQEVWRAKIKAAGAADGPVAAEMVATLYDQSLDALAAHDWPNGLGNLFRRGWDYRYNAFSNGGLTLNQIGGGWEMRYEPVEITYRELRGEFGPSSRGGGRRMLGMQRGMMPEAAAMAAPADALMDAAKAEGVATNGILRKAGGRGDAEGPPPAASRAAPPPPRKNLAETAFFLPTLTSGADGVVTIEFTLPDTLTTWQFKSLAHDAALRSGTLLDTCVAAKDLMVEPMPPRFLREGDVVEIPVKVSNRSTGRLAGAVQFELADARTGVSRDELIATARSQGFDLAAGESQPVFFTVKVAEGTETLRYLATGSAGRASDGEEALLPVLSKRVLVTETVPITIRGPGEKRVVIERLAKPADTIESQSLVVQAASNPAWYAVLALPSIMESSDESTETLFTRLYANTLARHIATRDPRIQKIFEQWKGTKTLESPLEKNADLVKTLLAETPWVREAVDETEARARIALLFDANRAADEAQAALARLESLRNGDGGWPWFPGGNTCDSVSLGIIAGFGRLRAAGATIDVQPAVAALPWLDGRLVEEQKRAQKTWGNKPDDMVLTPIGAFALYARSFFKEDAAPQGEAAAAIHWGLDVGRRSWMKLDARRSQGHVAIALARSGDRDTARSIVDSLKQRSTGLDSQEDNWQGMWWRDPHPGWWSWAHAPIETQAVMIEAFDEVTGDAAAVEAMKAWLLSQKRTSRWPGSRATADAVAALFGRGDDLLASKEFVTVTVGGEPVKTAGAEAGTGFFEERFVRREITPKLATVVMKKADAGIAWGGIHWQYLDDIANVPAAGRAELAIEKKLFVKRFTKAGPVLEPAAAGAATKLEVGDELVVRLVVTSDRDYEFLELSDHRPSLTEPVDVLSGWRWGDGVGWYVALRDASTQLFFERLPRGTHVFEYSLRAAHRGSGSSGFAKIQSRYAPEFSAHSASVNLDVK
ncbi:MAG: alpha-2-macroglobulin family protein [Planctomycetota bacterium]